MTITNSDTIGNRTRDLPACSAVPQPTAPPRALNSSSKNTKIMTKGKRYIWSDFFFPPQLCMTDKLAREGEGVFVRRCTFPVIVLQLTNSSYKTQLINDAKINMNR
jgi:hypothetical protein